MFELLLIAFQFIGELLLQIFGELFFETIIRSLGEPFQTKPNAWMAALGLALFGAIAGGLSLLFFPNYLVPASGRIINLLGTPIAVGLFMMAVGAWRAKRGESVLRIDRFFYGYLFALCFALVRFGFAK